MEKITSNEDTIINEQISLIDHNLQLSINERIEQLQSAVELIEEMRKSLAKSNELTIIRQSGKVF
jgi:hypothetical protein